MKIPVIVYETTDYDTYMNPPDYYKPIIQPSKDFGDFFLNATYYLVSMHSGCRHNWVKEMLNGQLDVYVRGGFRKREVREVPGELCSGCGRARYV